MLRNEHTGAVYLRPLSLIRSHLWTSFHYVGNGDGKTANLYLECMYIHGYFERQRALHVFPAFFSYQSRLHLSCVGSVACISMYWRWDTRESIQHCDDTCYLLEDEEDFLWYRTMKHAEPFLIHQRALLPSQCSDIINSKMSGATVTTVYLHFLTTSFLFLDMRSQSAFIVYRALLPSANYCAITIRSR